ncbi:MAG: hypothetical protein LRY36_02595 [Alphaproteobacteria bacterium]|nr:hypothetical protein [Alphaproteobacteria bacterium]
MAKKLTSMEIVKSVSDSEFKDYVGPNAYKFDKARKNVARGKYTSWGWMPFILGPLWAGYYKWWYMVFVFCLLAIMLGSLGSLISFTLFAIFARSNYVIHASKKITKIKKREPDPEHLRESLKAAGGTSRFTAFLALIIYLICCAIGTSLGNALMSDIETTAPHSYEQSSVDENPEPLPYEEESKPADEVMNREVIMVPEGVGSAGLKTTMGELVRCAKEKGNDVDLTDGFLVAKKLNITTQDARAFVFNMVQTGSVYQLSSIDTPEGSYYDLQKILFKLMGIIGFDCLEAKAF